MKSSDLLAILLLILLLTVIIVVSVGLSKSSSTQGNHRDIPNQMSYNFGPVHITGTPAPCIPAVLGAATLGSKFPNSVEIRYVVAVNGQVFGGLKINNNYIVGSDNTPWQGIYIIVPGDSNNSNSRTNTVSGTVSFNARQAQQLGFSPNSFVSFLATCCGEGSINAVVSASIEY